MTILARISKNILPNLHPIRRSPFYNKTDSSFARHQIKTSLIAITTNITSSIKPYYTFSRINESLRAKKSTHKNVIIHNIQRHLFRTSYLAGDNNSGEDSKGCRLGFHPACEAALNHVVNDELAAAYTYTAMAWHFARADVGLPGFARQFRKAAAEEADHARQLMDYIVLRGGVVTLTGVQAPPHQTWESPLAALEAAIQLERHVTAKHRELHALADEHGDAQMADYIEGTYLAEQVASLKQLADQASRLRRAGAGLGEFLMDQELLEADNEAGA